MRWRRGKVEEIKEKWVRGERGRKKEGKRRKGKWRRGSYLDLL
jgi:hypothetical protein